MMKLDIGTFAYKSKVFNGPLSPHHSKDHASSPLCLSTMPVHMPGGVVLYAIGESLMKVSCLHTQRKDDGQYYFTVGFRF